MKHLNQPPRPRQIRCLRAIFLMARPPLLCQGGEFARLSIHSRFLERHYTKDIRIANVAAGALASGAAARPWIDDLLEPIRQKYGLPSLAGAIVTSKGLIAIDAVGVRKSGTTVPVTADDMWHLGSDTKSMTAHWRSR